MRVIIAGGREILDDEIVERAVEASGFRSKMSEVITGGAPGVDTIAYDWAAGNGMLITVKMADWRKHGNAAGPMRNEEMARLGDALIAIPGKGPGTRDMIVRARRRGLPVFVYEGAA